MAFVKRGDDPLNENPHKQTGYFSFPFTPYDIQVKFMHDLYSVIENGGVGIFESPTGTVSLNDVRYHWSVSLVLGFY